MDIDDFIVPIIICGAILFLVVGVTTLIYVIQPLENISEVNTCEAYKELGYTTKMISIDQPLIIADDINCMIEFGGKYIGVHKIEVRIISEE